jgi:hypothetical protein
MVYEIKASTFFIFNSALQQCDDLTWKKQVFQLQAALKSAVFVIDML